MWVCGSESGLLFCTCLCQGTGKGDESVLLLNFKGAIWESEGVLSAKSGADPRGGFDSCGTSLLHVSWQCQAPGEAPPCVVGPQ